MVLWVGFQEDRNASISFTMIKGLIGTITSHYGTLLFRAPVARTMNALHETLRDLLVPVLEPYVRRIALFGSVARGDAGPSSDVDILVALRPPEERPALGLHWFTLEATLGEQLGRPVELVTEAALSERVRPYIENDKVVLYDDDWCTSNKTAIQLSFDP